MADRKQLEASKIDALYSWISYDLQKIKGELLNELKLSSMQVGSLYQDLKNEKDKSTQAIAQEIRFSYKQNQTIYDGLAEMLTDEVAKRLNSMDEKVSSLEQVEAAVAEVLNKLDTVDGNIALLENVDADALAEKVKEKVSEVVPQLQEAVDEIKYSFMQHQAIYDGLTTLISGEVIGKLNDVEDKLALLQQLESALSDVDAKISELAAMYVENDYKALVESVTEKTEETVAEHSRQILEAVNAIPVAENVDYTRIVDEVGDKVIDLLNEVLVNPEPVEEAPVAEAAPAEPVEAKIDYDKLIYGTAEKVVESLPYPEKVNYRRIDDSFAKAAEKVQINVGEDVIANAVALAVEKAMAALDIEAIAAAVAEKIEVPVVEPEPIDYDRLSDLVAAKLAASTDQTYDVVLDETGIEQIAEKVSEKLGQTENVNYERISEIVESNKVDNVDYARISEIVESNKVDNVDYARISEIVESNKVDNVDYARISEIVEEKIASAPCDEPTYNLVVDEEGVQAIAESVSNQLCAMCVNCAENEEVVAEEAPVEETPVVEEPVVEEVAEEPVVVEETPVAEEPVAVESASDEIAATAAESFSEIDNQLVDAETGLVIRLKKSFTAKMKQSEEKVKGYYSDIKNELTSYKRINSNVSWHGDRFNYGRDTIAKVNICGKTLCFYLALDPENPEYKTTVYHQKNVGNQKAYENTPFMVKIKSDAAAKKALRLVGYLAEKLGTEKEDNFEAVDYVEAFAYQSTKELFDEGYIKVTKEKKVDLDF